MKGAAALRVATYWKALFSVEASLDENGDKTQHYSDLGLVYTRIADWFDVGINFRSVYNKLINDQWANENRYYLNFIGRHKLVNIGFSHRVRLEYSQWDEARVDDFGTLRYRISINPPFEYDRHRERLILNDYKVKPYGSYEMALDSTDNDISSHTGKAGISVVISEEAALNLYYSYSKRLTQITEGNFHALGFEITLIY